VTDETPRLAVFFDEYTPSIFDLFAASRGLCRVVWIVGYSDSETPFRVLSRFGEVVDLAGMSEAEGMDHLVALRPDGVLALSDQPLRMAATLAAHLGLPFHSLHSASLMTDKLAQRAALQAAGLPVPAFASVPSGKVQENFPFPAVLKPRAGTGSRDTFKVENLAQVTAELARCKRDEGFILEEWLPDRTTQQGLAADLVSVESVVHGGVVDHIVVTGRFPLDPPFRETGLFLPSDLDPADWEAVVAVADAAIRAMPGCYGFLHTEIKMTPAGPRIIEINGRLGGGLNGLVTRVGGPSLFVWAMQLALGGDLDPIPMVPASPIAFYLYLLAPPSATTVESVSGVRELHSLAGIDEVNVNRWPGDTVSSQLSGHLDHVIRLHGMVKSHSELADLVQRQIPSVLELRFRDDDSPRESNGSGGPNPRRERKRRLATDVSEKKPT
jgi:biotin carboxylase